MKVLVTGASGMLGGAVARALAHRGDRVTVLQRRPAGLGLAEVLGDVSNPQTVAAAVSGQDAVVHLAAKVNVVGPESDYRRVNVEGTRHLLAAARAAGVQRFVFVSSPSVAHSGGSLVGAGAEPADPGQARGPYARTKAEAEQLVLAADGADLAVIAVRPHIVWGPGDTQLVERIIRRARRGTMPVIGSGAALVDTTYVDNAVDALVAALDRCPEVHGEPLVVSNGEPRPIAELLAAFAAAGGAPPPRRHVPVRLALTAGALVETAWSVGGRLWAGPSEADPPVTRFIAEQLSTAHWFDQRRTRELLRWAPRISLDEGFGRLREWYRSPQPRSLADEGQVLPHPA